MAAGDPSWRMWACFEVHSCMGAVAGVAAGDSMCYAFHETSRTFWPWGLNSELGLCGTAAARRKATERADKTVAERKEDRRAPKERSGPPSTAARKQRLSRAPKETSGTKYE